MNIRIVHAKYYYIKIIGTWVKIADHGETKGQIHWRILFPANICLEMLVVNLTNGTEWIYSLLCVWTRIPWLNMHASCTEYQNDKIWGRDRSSTPSLKTSSYIYLINNIPYIIGNAMGLFSKIKCSTICGSIKAKSVF